MRPKFLISILRFHGRAGCRRWRLLRRGARRRERVLWWRAPPRLLLVLPPLESCGPSRGLSPHDDCQYMYTYSARCRVVHVLRSPRLSDACRTQCCLSREPQQPPPSGFLLNLDRGEPVVACHLLSNTDRPRLCGEDLSPVHLSSTRPRLRSGDPRPAS